VEFEYFVRRQGIEKFETFLINLTNEARIVLVDAALPCNNNYWGFAVKPPCAIFGVKEVLLASMKSLAKPWSNNEIEESYFLNLIN